MNIETFHSKNILLLDEKRCVDKQIPTTLIVYSKEKIVLMVLPFTDQKEKTMYLDLAAFVLKKNQGLFYSILTEAWMVVSKTTNLGCAPSEHPNRKTIFCCFTCAKNKTLSSHFIEENDKLINFPGDASLTGALVELFNRSINSKVEDVLNHFWETSRPEYYYEINEANLYGSLDTKQ